MVEIRIESKCPRIYPIFIQCETQLIAQFIYFVSFLANAQNSTKTRTIHLVSESIGSRANKSISFVSCSPPKWIRQGATKWKLLFESPRNCFDSLVLCWILGEFPKLSSLVSSKIPDRFGCMNKLIWVKWVHSFWRASKCFQFVHHKY